MKPFPAEGGGLFDLQVNGYAGVDFNDAALTPAGLDAALAAMLRAGVTRCLPTLITAPEPVLRARLLALDAAVAGSRLGAATVAGIHLEGPFLNPGPGFRGCHPPEAMVPPDPALLERVTAGVRCPVRLLTLAPERNGAEAVVRWARTRGIVVAIGHADAGQAVVARAAGWGVGMSTHLGNGLPHLLPKLDNPLMAQLAEERLVAGFIADGVHLPVPALRAMLRAKAGRAVLVTDAVAAAGAAPGTYGFAGVAIEAAADGSVRLPGTATLAGSALTLDQAVRNLVAWGIASPEAAIFLASEAPAAVLGEVPAGTVRWSPDGRVLAVVDGNGTRHDFGDGGML